MNIDFTFQGKIRPGHIRLFNQIAFDIRQPFIELINSLSKHAKCIDWWVSSPASRNTFTSPLFHYCCCLVLLQELIRTEEHFEKIITDSRTFKKTLEDCLSRDGIMGVKVIMARLPVKQRLKEFVRPIYMIFGIPLRELVLFFSAKLTRSLRKPVAFEPLTLIDTFVTPGYIEKDRYYPGVLDALSEKERKLIWFVPNFVGFRPWQYLLLLKRLPNTGRNFLLKDDFLKFEDYWCLWQHLLRVHKLRIKPSFFFGVDISPLVQEELVGFRGVGSSYTPLLNYCFAKRIREADVKLKLIIDWFENQNIDRGWNAGFRRFFPDVDTIGYQGYIASTHYLCMYPTKIEKDSGVIPHKMAVIGKGLAQSARRFCSDLDVCVAPAFRFQHVWRRRKYSPSASGYTILVALPIMINEAVHMLKSVVPTVKMMNTNTHFWAKPHPSVSQSQIQSAFVPKWPKQFEFVGGVFGDCVEKSNLLITSASSTCMETLAKGIPVIVVGNNSGLTHNPIPETISSDIWRLCYHPQEIADAIQFYQTRSPEKIREHESVGKRIREEYFEPVRRDGVRMFLGIKE